MNLHPFDSRLDAALRNVNDSLTGFPTTTVSSARPGQVWRARWDDALALVFIDAILDGARNLVRVAPVSIGTDVADDTAVILPIESSPLSVAMSVWPDLVTDIAEIVLERWITGVETFASLAEVTAAANDGQLRRGLPVLNELSPRHQERLLLELAMEVLSLAADLPSGNGRLEAILAGVSTATVAGVLNVDSRVALQILRGLVFIDRQQAHLLANVVDRDPRELLDANPAAPDELLATMTALRRGAAIRALAAKQQVSESQAFSTALRGVFALAARKEGTTTDWVGRADSYFEVSLAS